MDQTGAPSEPSVRDITKKLKKPQKRSVLKMNSSNPGITKNETYKRNFKTNHQRRTRCRYDEGSLYTPTGRKEILNPEDESKETLKKFREFGIYDPKAVPQNA